MEKIITPNILFEFLLNKFEDENDQDYDLHVNEYDLNKKSMKEGNDDVKKEDVLFNCNDDMENFLPYYNKATTTFSDKKDAFDLALCNYISSESVNGPTFQQFEHYQQSIEKNKVVDSNKSQSSTDTETIVDLSLVNNSKKHNSKKYWVTFRI